MLLTILIENEKIDLFKDEVIEINSSVANTDDVSKITTDYSKSFTVPASDNNNKIFKHFYNADIDNTFDARTKKNATILMGGLPFKIGKMRLEKVNVKKQKASSYTINFWGNLVSIKDKLKNDELSDLNFTALNFPASLGNKQTGLMFGLGVNRQIIYNFISNQIPGLSDTSVTFNSDKLTPSIRVIEIIKAIEIKYNIIFSRDFFNRIDFQELYLWLKPEKQSEIIRTFSIDYKPNELDAVGVSPGYRKYINFFLNPGPAFMTVPYTLQVFRSSVIVHNSQRVGNSSYDLNLQIYPNETYSIDSERYYFRILSNAPIVFPNAQGGIRTYIYNYANPSIPWLTNNYMPFSSTLSLGDIFRINENMPKIKVIDFLKGIFQTFKLVAIPQDDGTIYVNNLDDFYKSGKLYDFTNFIDFENYEVSRSVISNPISFKYQEPKTILNKKFLDTTGIAYSDELLELADDEGVLLDGEPLEVTLPFEQPLYELVNFSQFTNGRALQYATILDPALKEVSPKPILFYNNIVTLDSTDYQVILDSTPLSQQLNVPSQTLGLENPITSLNWGVEFSVWNGNVIDKTLFSEYWKSYILSIFNIKKRLFKYKAILPIYILTKLKLNDIIFIKERHYRINDFTTNLLNGETTLNLTNTFEPNFGFFTPSITELFTNFLATSENIYVANSEVMNISFEDIGFGTTWISAVKENSFLKITVTQNNTTSIREAFVLVNNGAGQQFRIYVNQSI